MGLTQLGSNTQQYLGQLGQGYGNQFANAMGIKGQADGQVASAGAMTQAGYGNALAAAASTYAGGMGGGGTNSLGSMQGFGNNMDGLMGQSGAGRRSSFSGWGN